METAGGKGSPGHHKKGKQIKGHAFGNTKSYYSSTAIITVSDKIVKT